MKRRSHKDFTDEVYGLVENEYTILSIFTGVHNKVRIKHNCEKCNNYEFEMKPSKFIQGQRCPRCSGNQKKSTENFKQEVYDLVGNEYTVLGEYVNSKTKILIRHNNEKCGCHTWEVTPFSFLSGSRCSKCFGTPKKTHIQFCKEVYEKVGNEYDVIGDYIDNKTKVRIKHNSCNTIYEVSPSKFLLGNRCPICSKKESNRKRTKNNNIFLQQVYELVKDEYIILSEYKTARHSIQIKHSVCGEIYNTTPDNFLSGSRCPYCARNIKKTTSEIKSEVYNLVNDEYEIDGEYINSKTKIRIKHNKCGNSYETLYHNFLKGSRCPICVESKGEQSIRHWLENNDINFKPQYIFNDLLSDFGNPLRFDFVVFKNNDDEKSLILIEYDGIFHYEKQYDEDGFETLQKHDQRKNVYCQKNNLKLIRIPYWEFDNIEKILEKEIINSRAS